MLSRCFPFTGTKGPSSNHENSPRPLLLLHQTLQLALCIGAGSVLLASTKPRYVHLDCQMVKRDSPLQRMHFHCSRVQWWQALHHSSRHLALSIVDLRFVCGCSAMETHYMKLPGSLELGSECWNRGQTIVT